MENYQMNRQCRSYRNPCDVMRTPDMFSHLSHLPVAMGYVPRQTCTAMFDLNRALCEGTLFKDLYRPFCGKRGCCR